MTVDTQLPLSQFIHQLQPAQRQVLIQFALYDARGLVDVQAFMQEAYGQSYPLDAIASWKQEELAVSVEVHAINLETARYHGIRERAELEYQIAQLHTRLEEVYAVIEKLGGVPENDIAFKQREKELAQIKSIGGLNLLAAYKLLPSLIQQEGILIEKLNKIKFIENRAELILSGADYVLRNLQKQAKDLPQAGDIVTELCKAAWASTTAHVGHQ